MFGPSPEDNSDRFQPGESKFPCASCHPSVQAPYLPRVIEGGPAYIAQQILDVCRHGHGLQLLVNWEGMVLRRAHGFLGATFWTKASCVTFTRTIPTSLVVCQEVPIEGEVLSGHVF